MRSGANGPGAIVCCEEPECVKVHPAKLKRAEDLHRRAFGLRRKHSLAGDAVQSFQGCGRRGTGRGLPEVERSELVEHALPAAAELGERGGRRYDVHPARGLKQRSEVLGVRRVGLLQSGRQGLLLCCAKTLKKIGRRDGPPEEGQGVVEGEFGAEQVGSAQVKGVEAGHRLELVGAGEEGGKQEMADSIQRQRAERPGEEIERDGGRAGFSERLAEGKLEAR